MKRIVENILRFLAQRIIQKYQPEIIGITGSVGKSSTKEAVYAVVSSIRPARRSVKNYNNEIGLPLTIIGADSAGRSPLGWLRVFLRGIGLLIATDEQYPEVLILEMGADKPGDIAYLTGIARCHIGIITGISHSHLAAFKSLDAVRKEKSLLVRNLEKSDWAVLNADDERVASLEKEVKAKVVKYSMEHQADIRGIEPAISFRDADGFEAGGAANAQGLSFKLVSRGSAVPVFLPGSIGYNAVYASLAAAAVGEIYGMNLVGIAEALQRYKPPKGRMVVIPGIKHTMIIDDTYNSSPVSSLLALRLLARIPKGKKARIYVVMGDMLELGSYSEEGHRLVGAEVAKKGFDFLLTVGDKAKGIARGAEKAGMTKSAIFNFTTQNEAGRFLQDRIEQGDIILVKGSQGARMERVVLEIMEDPKNAGSLLVRQDPEWKK